MEGIAQVMSVSRFVEYASLTTSRATSASPKSWSKLLSCTALSSSREKENANAMTRVLPIWMIPSYLHLSPRTQNYWSWMWTHAIKIHPSSLFSVVNTYKFSKHFLGWCSEVQSHVRRKFVANGGDPSLPMPSSISHLKIELLIYPLASMFFSRSLVSSASSLSPEMANGRF